MKTILIALALSSITITTFITCFISYEVISSREWDWNVKQEQLRTCAMFNEIYKTMYYNADDKVEQDAIKNQWSQMKDVCVNWNVDKVLDNLMKYDDSKFYSGDKK